VLLSIIVVVVFETSCFELLFVTLSGCTEALKELLKKKYGKGCTGPLRLVLSGEGLEARRCQGSQQRSQSVM
jgi:hypothetical protein